MSRKHRLLLLPIALLLANSLTGCTLLEDILRALQGICETDPLVVTKTVDTNDGLCTADDCSLREAVITANACPGPQTIQLPAGGYHLTRAGAGEDAAKTGDLDITDDLTINGVDVPSIHGDDQDRIFEIFEPAVVELNLMILVQGKEQLGGAIRNHSTLTINSSAINNNHAVVPPGGAGTSAGGGLFNDQGAVANSNYTQFLENTADSGGAIHNFAVAQLTVNNGLMAGNIASMYGGAVWNNFQADATITNIDLMQNQADMQGGAIYNDGHLEMELNKFEENTEADQGGGLWNGPDGEAFLYQAWFTNNSAGLGGAVFNKGLLHLYQSSLTINTAFDGFGGGAYNDGSASALFLQNTTVSGNMIVPPGSPGGSGVYNGGGDLRLEFDTFAYNNADGVMNDGGHATVESSALAYHSNGNCSGDPMLSNGHNIEDQDSCHLIEPSDLVSTDPLLAPLAMNGGVNLNHALQASSPAIDSGDLDTCIAIDQRGVARPQGSACDRGAYEADGGATPAGPTEEAAAPTEVPTPTATPSLPITINFNADQYSITLGDCTTLRWEVKNADKVFFEGEEMPALEAEQVCPQATTRYTLQARNGAGDEEQAFVTVEVTAEPPATPQRFTVSGGQCTANGFTVNLIWTASVNEDGFHIYRDGSLIATVGPGTTSYTDQPPFGGPYTYGLEAFNEGGASNRLTSVAKACNQ
ncbi:MAG: choice-of-anchor Q domain-containing protein [Anaerolineales bacterium]